VREDLVDAAASHHVAAYKQRHAAQFRARVSGRRLQHFFGPRCGSSSDIFHPGRYAGGQAPEQRPTGMRHKATSVHARPTSGSSATQPVIVVYLREQLFNATSAIFARKDLARRATPELHTRPIQPFCSLLLITEDADCERNDISWIVLVHGMVFERVLRTPVVSLFHDSSATRALRFRASVSCSGCRSYDLMR
jgi:hypothetical protein